MRELYIPLLVGVIAISLVAGCQTPPGREGANQTTGDDADTILEMERAALDRWGKGDPSGFLEISAPDVVYFDPFLERRSDGLEALTSRYEKVRGKVHVDRYELLNPKVQLCGEAAVLTYNFASYTGAQTNRWNCTEVYRRTGSTWRIIQTHWSFTQRPP